MLTRRETFCDAGNLFFSFFLCDGHLSESLFESSNVILFIQVLHYDSAKKVIFKRSNNHILDQELENFFSRNQKAKTFGFVGHKISVTDP